MEQVEANAIIACVDAALKYGGIKIMEAAVVVHNYVNSQGLAKPEEGEDDGDNEE